MPEHCALGGPSDTLWLVVKSPHRSGRWSYLQNINVCKLLLRSISDDASSMCKHGLQRLSQQSLVGCVQNAGWRCGRCEDRCMPLPYVTVSRAFQQEMLVILCAIQVASFAYALWQWSFLLRAPPRLYSQWKASAPEPYNHVFNMSGNECIQMRRGLIHRNPSIISYICVW